MRRAVLILVLLLGLAGAPRRSDATGLLVQPKSFEGRPGDRSDRVQLEAARRKNLFAVTDESLTLKEKRLRRFG